jgi:DNA-binding transcriptional LysR family regulator
MHFRQIECFLAVAEELHFSRAAKRLHLSQPPLSKHIQQLEQELGVQLFMRNRRSVTLTEAGRIYQEKVRNVMYQLEEAKLAAQRAQEGQTGELKIGFLSALFYDFIPPLLMRFRRRFPDVQVTLLEMVAAKQFEAVSDGKVDVAFPGLPPDKPGLEISSRILRKDKWFACFHSEHPLAQHEKVSLEELRRESFVFIQRAVSPAFDDALLQMFRQANYTPRVAQTASRAQSLLSLVAAGVGISIFPGAVSALPSAGLVFRPLRDKLPPYEHSIIWNKSNKSAVLAEFLKEPALQAVG